MKIKVSWDPQQYAGTITSRGLVWFSLMDRLNADLMCYYSQGKGSAYAEKKYIKTMCEWIKNNERRTKTRHTG